MRLALLLMTCGLLGGAVAKEWVVETHALVIRRPASIEGREDAAIGDFGVPLYGASMVGQVVYPSREADQEACQPLAAAAHQDRTGLPQVLLVNRGGCFFIEKALNAERAGYKAVLVADNVNEALLTMAMPEDRPDIIALAEQVSIPAALITQTVGNRIKGGLSEGEQVEVELDWTESMAHPSQRVDWQMWTSSNDGCGVSCARQVNFKKDFAATAQQLQQEDYITFEPHFVMHRCAESPETIACADNCIHSGRYCTSDAIGEPSRAKYKGWQVVEENKRQLCVFQAAKSVEKPWLWWAYAASFAERCTMSGGHFGESCANEQIAVAGLSTATVRECMGNSHADEDHPLLQDDINLQVDGPSGRIIMLPTIVINAKQYRGRLDVPSVTRALCAGFDESTEPQVCLTSSMQVDDCASQQHECWSNDTLPATACQDTFRGYVCKCPQGFRGDGRSCEDIDECAEGSSGCDVTCVNEVGTYHCECPENFNLFGGQGAPGLCFPKDMCGNGNGGCEGPCYSRNGQPMCSCGPGLELMPDGKKCQDIDECAAKTSRCEQDCHNRDPREAGVPYECSCQPGMSVDPSNRYRCIEGTAWLSAMGIDLNGRLGGATIVGIIAAAALIAAAAAYAVQKYRMHRVMQREIRAIIRDYLPLNADDDGTAHLLAAEHGDAKKELQALHPTDKGNAGAGPSSSPPL